MNIQFSKAKESTIEPFEYELDKITFIVSPIYNVDSCKTIHDLVLNLMLIDNESFD